jgi:hypothetical protein
MSRVKVLQDKVNNELRQHNDRVAGELVAKIDEVKQFLAMPDNEISKLQNAKKEDK